MSPLPSFILLTLAFAAALPLISFRLGRRRPTTDPVKAMPYESGMDPVGDARGRFDIRFHLLAILFLVFDVEILFLYPWAVSGAFEAPVVTGVLLFILLLGLGYLYAWWRGLLDWR